MKNVNGELLKETLIKNVEMLTNQLSDLSNLDEFNRVNETIRMYPSKIKGDEANNTQEEDVAKISAEESSSDSDDPSDHSAVNTRNEADVANIRKLPNDSKEMLIENDRFIAVADFVAQEKSDLTLKKNDILRIIVTREDGWWLAENAYGDRGFVPKTFLKVYKLNETDEQQFGKPLPMPRLSIATEAKSSSDICSTKNEIINANHLLYGGRISDKKKQKIENNMKTVEMTSKEPNIETKILEDSKSESSDTPKQQNFNLAESKILKSTESTLTDKPIVVPDKYEKIDNSTNHQTYECYLAPRLSKSNYAFHDIYWNYEDNRLRKRRVRVSKLIKIIRLEKICLNGIDVHCRLIRAYLFDRKNIEEEHQIVSNVYTIKAHVRGRDQQTWVFSTTDNIEIVSLDHPTFIVRSNYKQKNVVLCVEATVIYSDHEGEVLEQSLGCIMIPIISEGGQCCMQNKNYTATLFVRKSQSKKGLDAFPVNTRIQITFNVADIPKNIVHQVDSLPDIILCNALFVPMFFYYRRLLGEFLTKYTDNCNSAALKAEPFLATFPLIADQPDVMEMLWKLWKIHKKNAANRKLSEMEEAERFRSFFLMTGFILHHTVAMPTFNWSNVRCFADRQAKLGQFREQYLHNFNAAKYLSRQRCHPINIYTYAIDIIGPHSIN
uniref:SH3 domain-containing protein n=1 Tax=Setaria digitata TaxID=48799 RepID=A0A915Q285_9BILA